MDGAQGKGHMCSARRVFEGNEKISTCTRKREAPKQRIPREENIRPARRRRKARGSLRKKRFRRSPNKWWL